MEPTLAQANYESHTNSRMNYDNLQNLSFDFIIFIRFELSCDVI